MAARNPWQKLKDEALKVRTPTQVLETPELQKLVIGLFAQTGQAGS